MFPRSAAYFLFAFWPRIAVSPEIKRIMTVDFFCKNEWNLNSWSLVHGWQKSNYDLGLDESLQFLSSLGLITLNFPSLPSLAIFLWVLFVLLIVEYSTLFLLTNCVLWIVTSKDEHCWALERFVLQNTKKAFC